MKLVSALLWVKLIAADIDSGNHTYLFKRPQSSRASEVNLSFTSKESLPYKEGEGILIKVDADCDKARAVDERFKTIWASYPIWICTVNNLYIEDRKWTSSDLSQEKIE